MILPKKTFFCCCHYAHYAIIMTKKFFFIPTLLSLHNCHEDKILFSYCYYVHYAIITTRNKLIFILTLPSLHNCHEKNTVVLSGCPVFLKDSWMIQQLHRQELQWRVLVFFFSGSSVFLKDSYTMHSQWTCWYCNDVGVTSHSISPWYCWYTVNETHDDVKLRYQSDIRISILDQSDFWCRHDINGRYQKEILQNRVLLQYQPQ